MDIEKLIERLKSKDFERDYDCTPFECGVFSLLDDAAAAALSTLQTENQALRNAANGFKAENEKLRAELDEKEKYYDQMVDALSATDSAELEWVKRERDAAVKDLETLCRDDVGPCEMAICELCAYNSGAQCSNPDGRNCDGYDVFNWKWRGPQKED